MGIRYDQMHGESHGRGGGKIVELDGGLREHGPQVELSRAPMDSQRLKWQAWHLQGSTLSPLSVYCGS